MNEKDTSTPLALLSDFVERATHWQEGGADRHTALIALKRLRENDRALRRLLCAQRHGHLAYLDDGEASFGGDEFCRAIDYMRESPEQIEQAWREAGMKRQTPRCSSCGTTEGLFRDMGSGGPWRCKSADCIVF